ncbi:epimerase [Croceivirga lutea]|uniref:NAD(P)H-binding protein n=1 Tax=Croceivirga lutea TaxID=1775167 RepID=UPI00163A02AA|nr:NAD(P)H-binding protein [Croceivirga lutea]GGG41177.1 epimerase [Croceivirga lutea]
MTKIIGIIGCGWLGLPLAKHLLEKGCRVKGTTTNPEKVSQLTANGVESYVIALFENKIEGDISGFLKDVEILIINIPPKHRKPPYQSYVSKIKNLEKAIIESSVSKVIFASSTSVYGNIEGEITEYSPTEPNTESGRQLVEVESNLTPNTNFKTTIVRFGGLLGNNRHPVNHIVKKEQLTNGEELINLIHLNDCIGIISSIIQQNYWGKIVNGVYPYHPKKSEYYKNEASKLGLKIPTYVKKNEKIVKKNIVCKNFLYYYDWSITTT